MKIPGIDRITRIDHETGETEDVDFEDLPADIQRRVLGDIVNHTQDEIAKDPDGLWAVLTDLDAVGSRFIGAVLVGMALAGATSEERLRMMDALVGLASRTRRNIASRLEEVESYRIDDEKEGSE